jgi:hypothetical protein
MILEPDTWDFLYSGSVIIMHSIMEYESNSKTTVFVHHINNYSFTNSFMQLIS